MSEGRVVFNVGLPPVSLRANSRAHYRRKKKDADEYSVAIAADAEFQICREHTALPMKKARVRYVWHYAGVEPDHSNLGGHTKYLQDILCMAPKNAKPGYRRWHLGILEDDRGITAEYEAVKVAHRKDERVEITVEEVRD
jgi:hypothetical protein